MNILVVTPYYDIKGRDYLPKSTSAIHYLLKYWPEDVNITVFYEYHTPLRRWTRYFQAKDRMYLKNGYEYEEDGINIFMQDLPLLYRQEILKKWQKKFLIKNLDKVINISKPDALILHTPGCFSSQYLFELDINVPVFGVLHYTDIRALEFNPEFCNILNTKFVKIFCRSKMIYDKAKDLGVKNLGVEIIESGIPVVDAVIEKHWETEKLELIYVGKFIKRKHVDVIIKALTNMHSSRDYHLTLIGGGPEEENVHKLVSKLNLTDKVTFMGTLPREQVFETLSKSDIFVMPSTGETLGLVYLEAMRQGCIPVGTVGEGIDGIIINKQNGLLVHGNDIEELHKLIENLLNESSEELKRMADSAKKTGDRYGEAEMGMRYYELINREMNSL